MRIKLSQNYTEYTEPEYVKLLYGFCLFIMKKVTFLSLDCQYTKFLMEILCSKYRWPLSHFYEPKYLTVFGERTNLWCFYPPCVKLPINGHRKTFLAELAWFVEWIPTLKFYQSRFHSLIMEKMKKCIPLFQFYPFLCLVIVILCKLMKSSSMKV